MNNNDELKNNDSFQSENNQNNSNQNENENVPNEQKNDFSTELEEQKKSLDAEKFAQQQEQYRQMLPDANQNPFTNNPYQWRIGFGRRFGAYMIDIVFYTLFLLVALFVTGIAEEMMEMIPAGADATQIMLEIDGFTEFVASRLLPLSLAITFVYYSLEVVFGQTVGKMLLGIIIGTDNKKFASYSQLFVRFAIKNLSSFMKLLFVLTAISFVEILSNVVSFVIVFGFLFVFGLKKQALHDTIAKTAVYFKDELQQFDKQ